MSKIQWLSTPKMMVFVHNDKILNVLKGSEQYKVISKLLKKKDEKGLIEFLYPETRLARYTKGEYQISQKETYKSDTGEVLKTKEISDTRTGEVLPDYLKKKLLEFSGGMPYESFKNFLKNLEKNPDKKVRKQLYKFLESGKFPLTLQGEFMAYKYVHVISEDNKNFPVGTLVDGYSKSFNNNPGMIVAMDRSLCTSDPNQVCSSGLHVASYSYAKSCGSGDVLIEVLVNPKDVVSVPNDYNHQKMRVCRYKVLSRNFKEINESYLKAKIIAGKLEKADDVDLKSKLEAMSSRDIVEYVLTNTGKRITISLKSKKSIINKALLFMGFDKKVSSKDVFDLRELSASQIIEKVFNQTGEKITFSTKSKKAVLRKATEILMENGIKIIT